MIRENRKPSNLIFSVHEYTILILPQILHMTVVRAPPFKNCAKSFLKPV